MMAVANRAAKPRLTIGLLLAERFTLCAFANFVDALRLAADEGDRSRPINVRWEVMGRDAVRSSCGVTIAPTAELGDPRRYDYVVLVGGLLADDKRIDPAAERVLQRAAEAGVPLVGVCTGVFILQRMGLMAGRRACVSWFHRADFLDRFGGAEPVSDRSFVVDGDRLTCSGGVSAAHLAAHILAVHLGPQTARKSLSIMMIAGRDETQPAPSVPDRVGDPLVRRALGLMDEMDAPLRVDRLAAALGVSRRLLERRFQAVLGQGPLAASRALRLERAKALLADRSRTVAQVAVETGFSDGAHFARVFARSEGMSPAAWRSAATVRDTHAG